MSLAKCSRVDTRQHNLTRSRRRNLICHSNRLSNRCRTAPSTGHRDSTIGAEIVAAVLNLKESAGAVSTRIARNETARFGVDDTRLIAISRGLILLSPVVLHNLKQSVLAVVPQYNIHTRDSRYLLGIVLCKTTYHSYSGRRVLRQSLTDSIAALFFGNSRDCAGVYDI